jgi:predicted porin
MKSRTWIATALATLAATTTHAQSSVTLFGIVDVSARSVTNGGVTVRQLAPDGMLNSRLGFRTEEDLGGGYRAGAWLETALNPDTGTINASGKFWHRRSTVSLYGPFGEIRLGRDLDATFWNLSIFDPYATVGVGSGFNLQSNLGSGAATLIRADNAISYYLPPNLGGLYGQLEVAAGEVVPGNKYTAARLGYQQGPLNVAVAYGVTKTATTDDFKMTNAGVSYDFGMATAMLMANVSNYGAKKLTNLELGVIAPVAQVGQLRASYQRANASGAGTDANDAHQIAVGYIHNLSKRTAIYATYSTISNDGGAAFVIGTPPAAVAGKSSKGYEVGIKHSF